MSVDIQESLLTHLYNTLVDDSDLEGAMGGAVRLYNQDLVPADAVFPYLVHHIDMNIGGDWNLQNRDTYYLDIWSHLPTLEECLDIKMYIMALIDGLDSSTGETTEFYLWRQTDGFIATGEFGILHYACQFNLKWLKDAQIGQILKR